MFARAADAAGAVVVSLMSVRQQGEAIDTRLIRRGTPATESRDPAFAQLWEC